MVVDLLAVESIKLSSLIYIITKLISLVIKVVNEIIMIRLLFIIYYAVSLFMPFMFSDNPLLPFIQSLIFNIESCFTVTNSGTAIALVQITVLLEYSFKLQESLALRLYQD